MESEPSGSRRVPDACVRALMVVCALHAASALDGAAQVGPLARGTTASGRLNGGGASVRSAGWRLEIAPYLWGAGLKGTVGVRGQSADIDVSFGTILDNLDLAIMLPAEFRKGRWGVGAELIYMKVSADAAVPVPPVTGIDFEQSQVLLELSPRYRVIARESWGLDAIAGVRFMSLDPTLTIEPQQTEFGEQRSWADPIVGARLVGDIGSHWFGWARADVGGFDVGSELTWQALGVAGYRISDRVAVAAAYRHLDVDYENADDAFLYDVAMSGPVLGVRITLGPQTDGR